VTISGLPPATADSCELLVEARPSGSLAPRATTVCRRAAPRAASGSGAGKRSESLWTHGPYVISCVVGCLLTSAPFSCAGMPQLLHVPMSNIPSFMSCCVLHAGLCMVPCAHAPLVQDDSCCVSTNPLGDTLTFRMPAASMGLSSLSTQQQTILAGRTGAVPGPVQQHGSVSTAGDASSAGPGGGCTTCGTSAAASCACAASSGALPGAVPASAGAEQQSGVHAASRAAGGGCISSSEAGLREDCWDAPEQAGCCVLEGDVRLLVSHGWES
jgi:hypothetical protein